MILKLLSSLAIVSFVGCGGGDSSNSTISIDSHLKSKRISLNQTVKQDTYISLTAGVKEQLIVSGKEVTWSSNNQNVTVDQDGFIFAKEDKLGSSSQAIISATPKDGSAIIKCYVTIVGWRANLSTLTIEDKPKDISDLLTSEGNKLYFTSGSSIYSSTDGMKTRQKVSDFPAAQDTPYLIKTPYSHYLRIDNKMYEANKALTNFEEILTDTSADSGHATDHKSLRHAFAYDVENRYIYAGEYTTDSSNVHAVYRGQVSPTGLKKWKKILEFDSASDDTLNSVLHIHVVTVDPYTGTLWIGTGDSDSQARLYYSTDHGESFNLFAIGAQYYRILSMWFTKDYIYWNTDSESEKQVVSRVKRTDHKNKGELTPRLTSGTTKVGVKYYVYKSEEDYFPASRNALYIESTPRKLSSDNIVYPVNDPSYNYREVVATLDNGSHWYHLWVKDNNGDDVVLMNSAAEGEKRDKRARVFGFKERSDGSVDVQELLSIGTPNSGPLSHYVQTVPVFQDGEGFIYLQGRETKDRIYKTKLNWIDQ
jgi:hypothetical protein